MKKILAVICLLLYSSFVFSQSEIKLKSKIQNLVISGSLDVTLIASDLEESYISSKSDSLSKYLKIQMEGNVVKLSSSLPGLKINVSANGLKTLICADNSKVKIKKMPLDKSFNVICKDDSYLSGKINQATVLSFASKDKANVDMIIRSSNTVVLSSSDSSKVLLKAKTSTLNVKSGNSSQIILKGSANNTNFTLKQKSIIDSKKLVAYNSVIGISDDSKAIANASELLVNGESGTVLYKGKPNINKKGTCIVNEFVK